MKFPTTIAIALTVCLSFVSTGQAALYTNRIQYFSFDPPTRTIAVGDTVVWVNFDQVGHTVTGDTEEEAICGSGFLYQGGICMRTFDTAGTFTYHCDPHESMVGAIVVEPAGNSPPSVLISSPVNGASFVGPTNVLIRAFATDPDGAVMYVTFFDGRTMLGSDSSAPFEVNRNLALGQHILTAVAFDDGGAQTTSFPVTITVSPALRILKLSVSTNIVLISTPTNYANILPQYITNLGATNWLPLSVRSNRVVNGALETFCGRPPDNSVFIRVRSIP